MECITIADRWNEFDHTTPKKGCYVPQEQSRPRGNKFKHMNEHSLEGIRQKLFEDH